MDLTTFRQLLQKTPDQVQFNDVIAFIEAHYDYTPTRFSNGQDDDRVVSEAGQNEGSCKIFALGKLLNLSVDETLHCFGTYYRDDVLKHPESSDHANIRNFMKHGWAGIKFDAEALVPLDHS